MHARIVFPVILFYLSFSVPSFSQSIAPLTGSWNLIPQNSHEIGLYGTLSLDIREHSGAVTIIQRWGTSRAYSDTITIPLDGSPATLPVTSRVWPTNVFMGLSMPVGGTRTLKATIRDGGSTLQVNETYGVRSSQGTAPFSVTHVYSVKELGQVLTYAVERPTRPAGPRIVFTLKRPGYREAFVIRLEDNWEITGSLPLHALFISLQGLANTEAPRLYLLYPNWPFTYVQSVFEFYRDKRHFTFKELRSIREALDHLGSHAQGYVVWDKKVRTSLIVAFTVAGLRRGVVVSEDLIPAVEAAGLRKIEDFRGRFTGQSDAEIYQWAYDQYWEECSKEYIIWLGGEHGSVMRPGVADFGVAKKVFFNDLSSRPTDTLEYQLARRVLGEMKPMSMVMGWHSYAKDYEREHVTLTSNYGHRVEGLHTLPNLSFSSLVPATPGFQYKNNHSIRPGKDYTPNNKVYISCIQTDGIGLGAWLKPGRGEIPYAWEVLMNYVWMAPAMAEYFYTMATPNDYFIGCLSGPGYMYPKAVPPDLLPPLIAKSREFMKVLDLRVFEIMDYSEGATVEGNTNLPKRVVDEYYKGMPEAIGFVNGYSPSHTFTVRGGIPFMSYDYYLSPTRPEADAVADLQELARINIKRPYFLLMHVRESSDIKRVKGILDKLGSEFEVVPLDVFLTMAGKRPTFQERFLDKTDARSTTSDSE